jgi:hypothetical protein
LLDLDRASSNGPSDQPPTASARRRTRASSRSCRAQIIEELSKFPISVFDNLEDYVHATEHALAITSVPARIADAFPEESRQLAEKRRTLLGDIEVLQRRGYIAEDATTNARGGKGLRNVAFDVRLFSEILLSALPACAGKTAVSVEELTSAKELASTVLRAIGERDLAVLSSPASLELRMRAFTLFADAYDKIRRAMTYLRWDEGDADTFAPTIYAHRGPGKGKATNEAAEGAPQSPEGGSSPEGVSSANGARESGNLIHLHASDTPRSRAC